MCLPAFTIVCFEAILFYFFNVPRIFCGFFFYCVLPQLTCPIIWTLTLTNVSASRSPLFTPVPMLLASELEHISNIPHTRWHVSSWFALVSIELSDSISSPALFLACKCAFVLVWKGKRMLTSCRAVCRCQLCTLMWHLKSIQCKNKGCSQIHIRAHISTDVEFIVVILPTSTLRPLFLNPSIEPLHSFTPALQVTLPLLR